VTISNTGNQATGALTASLSGANNGSFTLSATAVSSIAVGGTGTLTVVPNTGLAEGTYTATVTVSGGNSITASFTVTNDPVYGIGLNPSGPYTFPAAIAGYGVQTAKSVLITNTGNQATGALILALSGANTASYTLLTTAVSSIAVGGNDTFTVVPKTGLSAGTYTATVTVNGGNGITANFSISFTVNAIVNAAAPSISGQPAANTTYTQNTAATALTVTANASDGGTLSYQWYKNTNNSTTGGSAVGTNSASYTPSTATVGTAYYYVVVTNTNNSVNGTKTATRTSTVATVTILAPGTLGINIGFNFGAITITGSDGINTIRRTGSPTSLTLSATGYSSVQWYVDGVLKTGATGSSITLTAAAYDIRNHSVTFTGSKDGIPYSQLIPFRVVQ
jgi:hypothetical protein